MIIGKSERNSAEKWIVYFCIVHDDLERHLQWFPFIFLPKAIVPDLRLSLETMATSGVWWDTRWLRSSLMTTFCSLTPCPPGDFGHHVHCSLFYFVPQEAASTPHPSCTTNFGLFTKMPLFKILILHQLAVFFLLNLSVNFWAKRPTWLFLWLLEPIWNCSQVVKPRKLVALWQLFPISRNWTWRGGCKVWNKKEKKQDLTWIVPGWRNFPGQGRPVSV